MKGLRLLFAAVVLLLWVPVALLVRHALENVEKDRQARHRSVAERFFDEMERELTGWLHDEEERPFGHYRFLYAPEAAEPRPVRSPLADGPEWPFVLAHFQIDPDGTVSSPLWPVDADRAERIVGWRMAPGQERQRDTILGVLSDLVLVRTARTVPFQDAGTTVDLEEARRQVALARLRGESVAQDSETAPPAEEPKKDLLSLLNRGPASRKERTTVVQQSQAANVFEFTRPDGTASLEESQRLLEQLRPVDVSLEPMVGRPLDDSSLLLYRTVLIGDRAFRQGMVIDGRSLVQWVSARVLEQPIVQHEGRLASGTRSSTGVAVFWDRVGEGRAVASGGPAPGNAAPDGAAPDVAGQRFAFRHRFAEPFASVAARVELDPLPDPPATLYIYSLALLLGLTSTLGLWALYRAVAARLRFAERQSNFVSAVTHELKTPLTAIRMHGEMLRDGVVTGEERRESYYRVITAEAERLTRLIGNVLELSRLETQNRNFALETGDVRPVLREAIEALSPHAEDKGFALELEDDGPAEARFDRDALSQVIFNLVDNALKYAKDAAEKVIVLRSRNIGQQIELSVADRGPGVPRQHLRSVFEPFFRGEDEMTRTTKGTGIGLSLVQSLIEPMGGTVRGRNRPGGGFVVEIRLPAAEV